MAEKSMVIAGKYSGHEVTYQDGHAYIADVYVDFSKDNVLSYCQVDQRSGNALAGAVIAGEVGAIVAGNAKTYLVEITWKDGGTSLLKVTPHIFERIVATTYSDKKLSSDIQENEEKAKNADTIFSIIIGLIWLVFYLVVSN